MYLQLRGLPPFLSPKYDLKKHPNYKYTAEFDKKTPFDLNSLVPPAVETKAGGPRIHGVDEVDELRQARTRTSSTMTIDDPDDEFITFWTKVARGLAAAARNGGFFSNPRRNGGTYAIFFFRQSTTLQTLVVALALVLAVWGVVNLLEGYGSDNPAAKKPGHEAVHG